VIADATRTRPPAALEVRRLLLASEGRAFTDAAIELAVELARAEHAPVHVLSIARVHGTAFGLPNPGLLPTRTEWSDQRALVAKAVKALKRRGLEADGKVLGSRKAAAQIADHAVKLRCDAIVMGADQPRGRIVGDFIYSQEPYRVRRRSKVPVLLATH
jgi:nucleotide-binding universal stress UspA family protein